MCIPECLKHPGMHIAYMRRQQCETQILKQVLNKSMDDIDYISTWPDYIKCLAASHTYMPRMPADMTHVALMAARTNG